MTDSRPLLIVIYLRVSTEEQAKSGFSLPEQRERCIQKARELAQDAEFQPIVIDDAAGGDLLERKGLTQVREFVRENHPAYFVCLDPDRFSRELFLQLLVTKEIEAAGTRIVFVQHDYQNTPEGKLFYSLRGAVSEFEKAKILERTKTGLRRKLASGQVANGTHPFGYRYDTENDVLAVNEPEAEWARQIFAWAAERVPPLEIARRLNLLGVPTKRGRLWRSSTIQAMLRNTTYIGQMICLRWNTAGYKAQRQLPKEALDNTKVPKQRPKSEWKTIPTPPIIDDAVFHAVQASRRGYKRQSQKGAGMLSGLATCGLCGGPIHYIQDHSPEEKPDPPIYVLRCHHKYPRADAVRKHEKCTLPNVRAHIIESQVWAEVSGWILDPDSIMERVKQQQEQQATNSRASALERELRTFEQALADAAREQAETLDLVTRRVVSKAVGEAKLQAQTARIETLENAIAEAKERLSAYRTTTGSVEGFGRQLHSIRDRIADDSEKLRYILQNMTDIEKRRAFLRLLVSDVQLLPGREYELVPNLPVEL